MASRCLVLIPAAGFGVRAGAPVPKQYVALNGEPMLAHTVRAFLAARCVAAVHVVLSPGDEWADTPSARALLLAGGGRLRFNWVGGASRAASVIAGLEALEGEAADDDWVMVHDAARPCIGPATVDAFFEVLKGDQVGGLLALPLADTLKRADSEGRIAATIPRDHLWRAQTPQMFRIALLRRAYAASPETTDESAAVEYLGLAPKLVRGDPSNIKVTFPEDFALAARWLAANH